MKAIILLLALLSIQFVLSQDKIYKRDRTIVEGKVDEVTGRGIKYRLKSNPTGPVYTMRLSDMDSILYENGTIDIMGALYPRPDYKVNIKQLNTINFNLMGFVNFTIFQSYERRFKKAQWFALRVPICIGFFNGGPAGYGTISNDFEPALSGASDFRSFSIASGIQPKFYFNKHRIIRGFAGPEILVGYAKEATTYQTSTTYDKLAIKEFVSFTGTGMFGVQISPIPKLNITIDAGVGYGLFANRFEKRHFATWRMGASLGTNF